MSSSKRKFSEFKNQHVQQTLTHGQLLQMIQGHKRIKDALDVMAEGQQMILDALCSSMAVKVGEPIPENVLPLPGEKELDSQLISALVSAQVSAHGAASSSKKPKRQKQDGPKKTSGYLLFCEEERARPTDERPAAQEFMTILGHKWSQLSEEGKQAFNERAKTLNESYKKTFDQEKEQQKQQPPSVVDNIDSSPKRMPSPPESVVDESERKEKAPLSIPTMYQVMEPAAATVSDSAASSEDAEKKKKKKKKNKDRQMIEQHMQEQHQ